MVWKIKTKECARKNKEYIYKKCFAIIPKRIGDYRVWLSSYYKTWDFNPCSYPDCTQCPYDCFVWAFKDCYGTGFYTPHFFLTEKEVIKYIEKKKAKGN